VRGWGDVSITVAGQQVWCRGRMVKNGARLECAAALALKPGDPVNVLGKPLQVVSATDMRGEYLAVELIDPETLPKED